MRRALLIPCFAALVALAAYCDDRPAPTEGTVHCVGSALVCTNGTVQFRRLEGGFWVVAGDNGTAYDPVGGIPSDFMTEGLRVKLVAKPRPELYSFHMYGTIVEIVSISKLP